MVLMPSTPMAYPPVISRHLTSFRVVRFSAFAGQRDFCSGFDPRQLPPDGPQGWHEASGDALADHGTSNYSEFGTIGELFAALHFLDMPMMALLEKWFAGRSKLAVARCSTTIRTTFSSRPRMCTGVHIRL